MLNIRIERKKNGWTQEYVAQNIGLTRTAVHDLETGKQLPSYKILVKLENLFGLPHKELFKDTSIDNLLQQGFEESKSSS